MPINEYLQWMAAHTETQWCNDSAIVEDLQNALLSGAVGCTSNPPLSYQTLTTAPEVFAKAVAQIPSGISEDQRAAELIGVVVRHLSGLLVELYEQSEGRFGYIRAQVQPNLSHDREAMLAMGRTFASWAPNIKVKIPGTAAGIWVLEELAAAGIPTNPTVCVSVSQIIAAAKAHERGVERAIAAGIKPAPSTSAFVMGRLQDYLGVLNQERGLGLSPDDLESAALAVAKRCYQMITDAGYQQVLMPAAFRSPRQVAELVGSKVVMTIHPDWQRAVAQAAERGEVQRQIAIDNPVDPNAIARVAAALPEFVQAYEPEGLTLSAFDTFGATVMTLTGFDVTGWQKLRTL